MGENVVRGMVGDIRFIHQLDCGNTIILDLREADGLGRRVGRVVVPTGCLEAAVDAVRKARKDAIQPT